MTDAKRKQNAMRKPLTKPQNATDIFLHSEQSERERGGKRGVQRERERGKAGHIPPLAAILKFLGAIAAFRGHVSARDYNGVARVEQIRSAEGRVGEGRLTERGLKTEKERGRKRGREGKSSCCCQCETICGFNCR